MAKVTKTEKKKKGQERRVPSLLTRATNAIGDLFMRAIRLIWAWSWILGFLLAGYLVLVFVSYSKNDPSFSFSTQAAPHNWGGVMGAYVADFMYTAFGLSAWCFVLGFFMISCFAIRTMFRRLRGETDPSRLNPPRLSALVGFVALLIGSSCLEALAFRRFQGVLPGEAGGILGHNLSLNITHFIGWSLASVVFFALIVIGLSLLLDFSWTEVAERIGAWIENRIVIPLVHRLRHRKDEKPNDPLMNATPAVSPTLPETKTSNVSAAPTPSAVSPSLTSASAMGFASDAPTLDEMNATLSSTEINEVHQQSTASTGHGGFAPEKKLFEEPTPGCVAPSTDGRLPLSIFDMPTPPLVQTTKEDMELMSRAIVSKLQTFNIEASVQGAETGPVITQYRIELAPGVKGAQIEGVRDDLRRALGVRSVRVVPSIVGTSYIGIEIPNPVRETVRLREVLDSDAYRSKEWLLPLSLGKDIKGTPFVFDLAKMPHLLVAGTTGSGKSVGINSMILTMLYHCDPSQLRLVLIDPKMLEFSPYNGIPHLLTPVVTDMNKAAMALKWLTREMDRRYAVLASVGVRHFTTYNEKVKAAQARGEVLRLPSRNPEELGEELQPWPYIVCVIDELADLMLTNRKEVEGEITRIAQKARAAGIHLILATQRPSTDVVTSLIKTNVGTRISFQVASALDSRIILGGNGAESLLGNGDMLFKRLGDNVFTRIQGCFVSDDEVLRSVDSLREYGAPDYVDGVTEEQSDNDGEGGTGGSSAGEEDPLYDQAVQIVLSERRPTISFVQRKLGIGYNRAANLLEGMENAGIVSKANSAGKREILVPEQY